jgi:hypothetical protein
MREFALVVMMMKTTINGLQGANMGMVTLKSEKLFSHPQ